MTKPGASCLLLAALMIAVLAGCTAVPPAAPAAAPGQTTEETAAATPADGPLVVVAPGDAQEAVQTWIAENYPEQAVQIVTEPDPQHMPDVIVGVSNFFPTDGQVTEAGAAPAYAVDVWAEPGQAAYAVASEIGKGIADSVVPQLGTPEVSFVLTPEELKRILYGEARPGGRFVCCSLAPLNPFCTPNCQLVPTLTMNVGSEEEQTMLQDELVKRNINVPVVVAVDPEVMSTEKKIRISRELLENLPATLPEIIEAAGSN